LLPLPPEGTRAGEGAVELCARSLLQRFGVLSHTLLQDEKFPVPWRLLLRSLRAMELRGEVRGGHAHKELQQLIIAVNGSFDVVIDDGRERQRFHLNRSYFGLYLPKLIWRELDNFSSGSVCLVLASAHYAENEYIRDYREFCRTVDALPR